MNRPTLISVRLARFVIPTQYEGFSTSSDIPMPATPVTNEPVPDTTADEPMPDTSDIPVLPNSSTYASGRNPRVPWRSDVQELPTPQTAPSVALSPECAFSHITRHDNESTTLVSMHTKAPEITPAQPPMTPHLEIQPETPLPVPSPEDTPMPLQPDDATPPWVYQEPDTPWAPREPDTPSDIPQWFVLSPPIQVPPSREESNMSTGDALLPPSIPQLWFDETPPPPPTTHDEILAPVP